LFDHITVSPKLGAPMRNQHHNPTLGQWDTWETPFCFKWVIDVGRDEDVPEAVTRAVDLSLEHGCDRGDVWVMPEGATPELLARRFTAICDAAAEQGINVS
ncbi:hypothetical protein ACQ1ZF_13225, partial [Enterococcus faecalis]